MQFLNPWGWLGLLALPAILALHFFRRRYQTRPVATVLFWRQLRENDTQGRAPRPIRSSWSLWVQLLAALLLSVLLAGPQSLQATGQKELLVILDSAYALQARRPDGRSTADLVRTELKRRLDQQPATVCTVIEHGPVPRLLSPRRASLAEARQAVDRWQPTQPRADWRATLALLRQFELAECALWVFSDTESAAWKTVPNTEFHAVGTGVDNLALAEPYRVRLAGTGQENLRVTLHNFTGNAVTTELRLRAGQRDLHRWPVTVPAGGAELFRAEVPESDQPWDLALPADALEFDNRAVLCPLRQAPLQVLFDFAGPALQAAWQQVLAAVTPFQVVGPDRAGDHGPATLILSDQLRWIERDDRAACILVMAPALAEPRLYRPPFLAEINHPLLRGVDWAGTLVALGTWPGSAVSNQLPRLSARDAVVLAELPGRVGHRFLLHADLTRGNLTRQPAFPILAQNAVELARSYQPGLRTPNLRFGERLEFRPPAGTREICLAQADWRSCAASLATLRLPPDRVGLFSLSTGPGQSWEFAVNHNEAATSDLRATKPAQYRSQTQSSATLQRVLHQEWIIGLALLVLALMLADWHLAARRKAQP